MSRFDNPFVDTSATNPFADPAVMQARGGSATGQQPAAGPAEFSPFDKAGQTAPAPPYTSSAQQRVSTDELERRQRELEARARELERREEEQRRREAENSASAAHGRNNNWPPLPSCCPVGPCFYQDFDLEIPVEFRLVVRTGYYLWLAHVCLLFVNFIGALAYFIVVQASDAVTSGTVFGVSILLCIILPPCSYIFWFRPLYKAFKNDSSFNFFIFFGILFIQICLLVIQCLGINYLGSCGWINSSATLKTSIGAGAFMMVVAALFTALLVADIILLIRVHRIYRSTGASFAKARQELRQGVASSEAARGAATAAATTTFAAMASGAGGGGGGGGGRY